MSLKRADKFSIVSVTVEDVKQAQKLSQILLKSKLCACIHIVPQISSMYWWQGQIKETSESWMIIKTHQSKMRDLLDLIVKNHSYDVPEVLEIKPAKGLRSTWIGYFRPSTCNTEPYLLTESAFSSPRSAALIQPKKYRFKLKSMEKNRCSL
jgi:periplasmic divalent cation tolerance protein